MTDPTEALAILRAISELYQYGKDRNAETFYLTVAQMRGVVEIIATIEAMRREIAALRERTTPKPIESAPQDGTSILVFNYGCGWDIEREGHIEPGDTHWLPMPPPPEGET